MPGIQFRRLLVLFAACFFVVTRAKPSDYDCLDVACALDCPDPSEYPSPNYSKCCSCPPVPRKVHCKFNGVYYKPGDTFPAGDGCNNCGCLENGQVVCTLIACPPKRCKVNGVYYNPGDSFPAPDGCNTCTCSDNGLVACTKKLCLCPPTQVFNSCGSACTPTCSRPFVICTLQCVARCECPRNTIFNTRTQRCVLPSECPRKIWRYGYNG